VRRTDLLRLLLRAVVQVAVDVRWQRRLCSANGIICAQEIGGGSDLDEDPICLLRAGHLRIRCG